MKYYDVRIKIGITDDESGKTKYKRERMIVHTTGITEAERIVMEYYSTRMASDYTIKTIIETDIEDILK